MKKSKIIVIGDSPGACVCAIYLKTANIPITLIHYNLSLEYVCTYVAGLPNITADEFNEKSFDQAKNMKIECFDAKDVEIKRAEDGKLIIKSQDFEEIADYLVLDKNIYNLEKNENVFIIEDFIKNRESIEVAQAGCKIAFAIKELLNK